MSRSRQPSGPQVRTFSLVYESGFSWRARSSDWGELVNASRGMMTVHMDGTSWIVPPHQAVWVPPGVVHSLEAPGRVTLRMLYVRTDQQRLLQTCRVIQISPLLRELLRRTMRFQTLDRRSKVQAHLLEVLLDLLIEHPVHPVELPMPRDARGVQAATLVRTSPSARHTLSQVARASGASARTLERVFRAETGLPFGAWRQRARLVRSLELLTDGASVTHAALAVGYESTSAFVAAFRRALGTTPGRYFKLSRQ